jgi:hypothetical protein
MPVSAPAIVRREDGQTVVEFAIILFPLLLLVVGIIQFGIAINFWQDQQRLAAAGARVAIVNCAQAAWCTPTLEQYLEGTTLSNGNKPNVTVCFESKTGDDSGTPFADVGDSITVDMEAPFKLVPLFGVGTITIGARTTMRLEQAARHAGIAGAPVCP